MAPRMLPGRGSSLPLVVDASYLSVTGNSGSVELESAAQARVPEGNPVSLCGGPSHLPFSKQQGEWDVQGDPILSPLYLAWESAHRTP